MAAVTALILVGVEGQALSYLLPAEAILASIAVRRDAIGFDTLVAEGSYQKGNEAPVQVWEAIRANKAHRVERKREGNTEITLTVGARRWRYQLGDKGVAPSKADADLVMTFLANTDRDPGAARAVNFCKRLGIDLDVVSLGRLDGRPAFIIGAKPWEPNKPQIWVDKQFRVPVRLVQVDASGLVTDTQLHGFGSPATSEWYPNRVEVWQNGQKVETTIYERAQLNLPVDDKLIAPPS